MKALGEVVADAARRPQVVSAVTQLIDSEVQRKSGISGAAIKLGYSAVSKLKGGRMIPDVVDGLLPEFVSAIEPLHARYRAGSTVIGFAAFLKANEKEAIGALLRVTDRRAEKTDNAVLGGAYRKLRPMAERQVAEALPALGALLDRFCTP